MSSVAKYEIRRIVLFPLFSFKYQSFLEGRGR